MSIRKRMAIVIGGGLVAATAAWASAQVTRPQAVPNPIVLSGSDLGFRVEAYEGNTPVGKLVVKVDGQWVEARFSSGGVKRLTMK